MNNFIDHSEAVFRTEGMITHNELFYQHNLSLKAWFYMMKVNYS